MEVIRKIDTELHSNSKVCKTREYSFIDKDIDLAVATIKGRYPEKGYCLNKISKELVYIDEGIGKIIFKDKEITFKKGDSILIDKNEKYYWESDNCKALLISTPAWSIDQYEIVD